MPKKTQIGFLGTGQIATFHLITFADVRGGEVAAMADPDSRNLESFKTLSPQWPLLDSLVRRNPKMAEMRDKAREKVKGARTYKSVDDMLDAENLDGVIISTPHTQHFDQMMTCINRGINVLCEKPMVSKVEDAKKAIAAARKKNVILTIGYQRHTMPEFGYMRDVVANKGIGDLVYVSVLLCQDYYTGLRGTWRENPKLSGGGQINNSGSHIMEMLLFITNQRPTEVFCHQDNCGTNVDINTSTSVRFGKDLIASIDIVGRSPFGFLEEWTFNGTDGAVRLRDGKVTRVDGQNKEVPVKLPKSKGGLIQRFVNAIQGKGTPAVDPAWGLRVIQLTEGAWKSAKANRPVKVDWTLR